MIQGDNFSISLFFDRLFFIEKQSEESNYYKGIKQDKL